MARRRRRSDVGLDDDVALLERVLGHDHLDEYEVGVFGGMLDEIRQRVEEYGDDAYGLTSAQRAWAERVADRPPPKRRVRLTGEQFDAEVLERVGRRLRLRRGPGGYPEE